MAPSGPLREGDVAHSSAGADSPARKFDRRGVVSRKQGKRFGGERGAGEGGIHSGGHSYQSRRHHRNTDVDLLIFTPDHGQDPMVLIGAIGVHTDDLAADQVIQVVAGFVAVGLPRLPTVGDLGGIDAEEAECGPRRSESDKDVSVDLPRTGKDRSY